MSVHYLKDYSSKKLDKRPRRITFCSPEYRDGEGRSLHLTISVTVADGDVAGVLGIVIERGGIGESGPNGIFRFLPWPCAVIEVEEI